MLQDYGLVLELTMATVVVDTAEVEALLTKLQTIVCHDGCDAGVVYLDQEGKTHYDEEQQCQVYDLEFFSPLGQALMELHQMITKLLPVKSGTELLDPEPEKS